MDLKGAPKAPFPKVQHEFRVHVAETAFDHVAERGGANLGHEVGGVLVGRLQSDDAGPYVLVTHVIDALHAEEKGAELTFTHATWDHVNREMDSTFKDSKIVGWWHTHPGFGIFLSDRDQFIHRSFFDLPHQVALVHDPKSRETGIFGWRNGEPLRLRRYWVGSRELAWEPPAAAVEKEKPQEKPVAEGDGARGEDRPGPAEERLWALVTWAAAGVILIAVGWIGGRWTASDAALRKAQDARARVLVEVLATEHAALGDVCSVLAQSKRAEGDEITARRLQVLAAQLGSTSRSLNEQLSRGIFDDRAAERREGEPASGRAEAPAPGAP